MSVQRNRTLARDLELLVSVADVGGSLELRLEEDGRTCALLVPAAGSRAYSERGLSARSAVARLRDALEQLAGSS